MSLKPPIDDTPTPLPWDRREARFNNPPPPPPSFFDGFHGALVLTVVVVAVAVAFLLYMS